MRSNSPFWFGSCEASKQAMKAKYTKAGKLEEYKKEVKEFGCVKGKWQIKPTDDAEQPVKSMTKTSTTKSGKSK
tara:strand:+ start:312 stop:533 length:222 start_codon:yes stop_codon:yes gene_type:complete